MKRITLLIVDPLYRRDSRYPFDVRYSLLEEPELISCRDVLFETEEQAVLNDMPGLTP